MGRFRQMASDDDGETGIDMSPLMDCVFILLIFFIVTTTFVEERGIEVDKPQAAAMVQTESTSVQLALTEKGQVMYEKQDIGFGGIQPLVKQMMVTDDVPVIIQADEATPAGLLVRAVDEARLAGAVKVSVGNRKSGN